MNSQAGADPNMRAAYEFAKGLVPTVQLPNSLHDIERCAEFVAKMDGPFILAADGPLSPDAFGQRLAAIEEISRVYVPDVVDALERISIALRLWSACISAAKTIAHETLSGPNTPQQREAAMRDLDKVADNDAVFAAGVECALAFKRRRNQSYSLDGVPATSCVRKSL